MAKRTVLTNFLTLAAGIVIGVIISNPEKIKEKLKMAYGRCKKIQMTLPMIRMSLMNFQKMNILMMNLMKTLTKWTKVLKSQKENSLSNR